MKDTSEQAPAARRLVLATLALEDAPVPKGINFYDFDDGRHILSLDFGGIAPALEWAQKHDVERAPQFWTDLARNRRHAHVSVPDWLGWRINVQASEDAPDDTLPADVADRLAHVVDAAEAEGPVTP
jgi:hypothetical protein